MLSKFGISNRSKSNDHKINNVIECLMKFRQTVRNKALEQNVKDKTLLTACDEVRSELIACGIIVKV